MSTILRCLLFVCLLLPAVAAPSWLPADCRQVLLVTTPDWDSQKGSLQRFELSGTVWRAVGTPIEITVGTKGLAWGRGEHPPQKSTRIKKEGDGRAPAGVYLITALWTRPGIDPGKGGFQANRIHPDSQGVDDPKSRYYNRIVRRSEIADVDWTSHERMDIPDYDRVLVVAHNLEQPQPGHGSCIFMHRWETPAIATAGCTVMSEENLAGLLDWLNPAARPRLVQLTRAHYEQLQRSGQLPLSTRD
jgi:L,D-peptidoglycan transpeptidase YkuD (ErfK/YbiS/YcfS/YnhG family)